MIKRGIIIALLIVLIVTVIGCQKKPETNLVNCEHKISNNLKGEIHGATNNNDEGIKTTITCNTEKNCYQLISKYGKITGQWSAKIYDANLFNDSIYILACNPNIGFIERSVGTPEPNIR